jgi:hypothetical protein
VLADELAGSHFMQLSAGKLLRLMQLAVFASMLAPAAGREKVLLWPSRHSYLMLTLCYVDTAVKGKRHEEELSL